MRVLQRFFRTRLLPTALSNAALGALLEWQSYDRVEPAAAAALLALAACLYSIGMGLNDFVDRERDKAIHPERPLPRGDLSPPGALRLLACPLVAACGLALYLAGNALWISGAILALILAYNFLVKSHAAAGPAAMGGIRAALVILGGAVAAPEAPLLELCALLPALVIGIYVASLTYLSIEEERARPHELRVRARVLFWLLVGGLLALTIHQINRQPQGDPLLLLLGNSAMILWTGGFALRPLRGTPPRTETATFRLLLGLGVLDLSICLSYDLPGFAAIPLALWLAAWRPFPSKFRSGWGLAS